MNIREKMELLSQAAEYDDRVSEAPRYGLLRPPRPAPATAPNFQSAISQVKAPGGRSVPVLKVLQTSACQNDCHYCAFRAGRDTDAPTSPPTELALGFDLMLPRWTRAGNISQLGHHRHPAHDGRDARDCRIAAWQVPRSAATCT